MNFLPLILIAGLAMPLAGQSDNPILQGMEAGARIAAQRMAAERARAEAERLRIETERSRLRLERERRATTEAKKETTTVEQARPPLDLLAVRLRLSASRDSILGLLSSAGFEYVKLKGDGDEIAVAYTTADRVQHLSGFMFFEQGKLVRYIVHHCSSQPTAAELATALKFALTDALEGQPQPDVSTEQTEEGSASKVFFSFNDRTVALIDATNNSGRHQQVMTIFPGRGK